MEDAVVDIGTQLKEQREKLGYSLQEASQYTRIRKAFLESIENNDFSVLPGQTYVTGFVKSYAVYLGLDHGPLLAQIGELRLNDGLPSLKPIGVVKHQPKRFSKPSSGVGWRSFVFGLFGVFLLSGAAYLLTTVLQDEIPTEVALEIVMSEKQPVQEPTHNVLETTLDPVVATSEPLQEEGIRLPEEELPAVVEESVSPKLKPLPFIPAGGSSLRMLALSEGSLIIYIDNRKPHQYKLHNGLDLTWRIKEMVKVESSDPGLARFWLTGQELDIGEMDSFQLQTESGD